MQRRAGSTLVDKQYNIVTASNTHFPSHIHNVYEVLCVRQGTARAEIDGKVYDLQTGEGLAVFPLQYHSYTVDSDSKVEIFVFSPHLIIEFDELVSGKKPVSSLFDTSDISAFQDDSSNILYIKAFFYDLCHKLCSRICLSEKETTGKSLSVLDELFLFVDRNYSSHCSLTDVAARLKYDYTYLSKLFKAKTGIRYNAYLNRYRVGKATYLLFNGDMSITQIAFEVGYNSVRTFNWEFQKIMHTTPAEYRSALVR